MSRSYRGAISAAVGLVAAGLISIGSWQLLEPREPDIPAYKGLQAQNTHYRPGGSRCNPARLEAVKGEASDERDRCEEAEEQHRLQSDDLVQQTRAANAAEATSRLTYGQSRVMAFQTIAGLFTLFAAIFAAWYARRAAQEGSRGSDAAEDALAHARTTSVMELRPYLHVEQMGFVEQSNVLDEPNLILKIKNYGQTPANNFSISAGSGRRGKTSASPNIRLRECPVSDEIPPGGVVTIVIPGQGRPGRLQAGGLLFATDIFVKFELRYTDKFGSTYGRFETYILGPTPYNPPYPTHGFRFHSSP